MKMKKNNIYEFTKSSTRDGQKACPRLIFIFSEENSETEYRGYIPHFICRARGLPEGRSAARLSQVQTAPLYRDTGRHGVLY